MKTKYKIVIILAVIGLFTPLVIADRQFGIPISVMIASIAALIAVPIHMTISKKKESQIERGI
jgi:Ca2+/Na+ antiporter